MEVLSGVSAHQWGATSLKSMGALVGSEVKVASGAPGGRVRLLFSDFSLVSDLLSLNCVLLSV